jgi:hypothetical protein
VPSCKFIHPLSPTRLFVVILSAVTEFAASWLAVTVPVIILPPSITVVVSSKRTVLAVHPVPLLAACDTV